MRVLIAGIAVVVLLVLAILGPDRNSDADVPPRLAVYVQPARQSALDHLDLLEPGSRLRLIGARCREDGAALLRFTNRWWWLFPRTIEVRVDPNEGVGGGGYVEDSERNYEAEAFFAEAREIDCAEAPTPPS